MMTVIRKTDSRVVKCVLHRVADIPGGVTVAVSDLGGSALFEGTPLAKGSDGLYHVCKTAQVLTAADATATTYEVAKGHHFQVGDYFAAGSAGGQVITAIDTSDSEKDVITVDTTLGVAIEAGAAAYQSAATAGSTDLLYTPEAIAGSNEDVKSDFNLFVSAWVIAVIREENAPIVTDTHKDALKGIVYV